MKHKLTPKLRAALLAAVNMPAVAVETVREVMITEINGVRVVLQEAEIAFSSN
jgi:hypothetical protein